MYITMETVTNINKDAVNITVKTLKTKLMVFFDTKLIYF
jgi:hypothetical protein